MENQEKKFSKIYDSYVNKVFRFIFLKVATKEIAQDLTSQVFTKVWNKMRSDQTNQINRTNRTTNIKNWPAYIYQIARNEIVDHYREKTKFQIISTEAIEISSQEPDIEQKQDELSAIKDIKQAISGLDDECQNIIIFRYVDNMPFKEIAEITGKPEVTVRVIAHRAIKELREILKKV